MKAEAQKYAKMIESAIRLQSDKESRVKTIEEGLIRYASAKAEDFYEWLLEDDCQDPNSPFEILRSLFTQY